MITLWHNPRCSKSRQALALLTKAGGEVTVRKYLEDTPSAAEIDAAQLALGLPAVIEMTRTSEKTFKALGLTKAADEQTLKEAMVQNPILIERPIAFGTKGAVIGRPPEKVLDLI